MPEISISIDDEEHQLLSDEYKKMSIEWLRTHAGSVPPPFEQWLATRLVSSVRRAGVPERGMDEMRSLAALEKLITGLRPHGFGLAHLRKHETEQAEAATAFAQTLAQDLGLSIQRTKRIEELLAYYAKTAKEIADAAHVGITNRAYGALHEACRELIERTSDACDHLGEDKAVGRVEGAVAVLVALNATSRDNAREKTEAFRQQMRQRRK